jgi:hypothetical protein
MCTEFSWLRMYDSGGLLRIQKFSSQLRDCQLFGDCGF